MTQEQRIEIPVNYTGATYTIPDLTKLPYPATGYYDITGSGTLSGDFEIVYGGTLYEGLRAEFFYQASTLLANHSITVLGADLTQAQALNTLHIFSEYNGTQWKTTVLEEAQTADREGCEILAPTSPYSGGTITQETGLSKNTLVVEGTVTLSGNLTITTNNVNASDGARFETVWNGTWSRGGNTVSIYGINCNAFVDAGKFIVTTEYTGSVWKSWVTLGDGQQFSLWDAGSGTNSIKRKGISGTTSGARALNLGDSSCEATGADSVASGSATKATGTYAASFNAESEANGNRTFAANSAIRSGTNSAGFNSSKGTGSNNLTYGYGYGDSDWSFAGGYASVAKRKTEQVVSAGLVTGGVLGTNYLQAGVIHAKGYAPNATPVTLTLYGTDEIDIAVNSVLRVHIHASAIQVAGSSGTVGDVATWTIYVTIKNIAGTTSIVDDILYLHNNGTINNTPSQSSQDAGAASWTLAPSADNVNDALALTFTGEANKTIWVSANLSVTEIKF